MRLNQATDYAFRMVLYLASLPAGTKMTGAALAEKQNTHRNRSLPGSASAVRTCRGSRRMQLKSCGYGLPLRKCLTFQTDCFYNKG